MDPGGDSRRFAWGHVILPERLLWALLRRHYGIPVENVVDWQFLSLNKLTAPEFKALFDASGLKVEVFRTNVSYSTVAKLFALVGKVPLLKKYFTHNLFCILVRT
jgi:hypothetical protein